MGRGRWRKVEVGVTSRIIFYKNPKIVLTTVLSTSHSIKPFQSS